MPALFRMVFYLDPLMLISRLEKNSLKNNRLEAVISMPSGVFKPYAGVSTAILIFTKTGHGGTDKVWFYDMKADGLSLDDKREAKSKKTIFRIS